MYKHIKFIFIIVESQLQNQIPKQLLYSKHRFSSPLGYLAHNFSQSRKLRSNRFIIDY